MFSNADSDSLWTIAAVAFVALISFTLIFLASRYKRCSSDSVLVVFGKVGDGQSSRCIHGGGALIWPLIQDYRYLSLTPLTINIDLKNALSLQNIRINVPSTFTVGVSTSPAIMNNAAERLLNLEGPRIENMAGEIIFGQLRLTIASLTIEQINQDRESLESIRKNVEPELNKIGLYLINVNITDITDESNYIQNIGKKAASEAINRAKVDVAQQERIGSIGESEQARDQHIQVAQNHASAEKGEKAADAEKRVFVLAREEEAVRGENTSRAGMARSAAELAVEQAAAHQRAEVATRDAEAQIQIAEAKAARERLTAQEVVRQEIERKKVEIHAAAEAEQTRLVAQGQADAILARYTAEAAGVAKLLASKASGYEALVKSCGGDARAAASLLLIEKLEQIVRTQVEAIKNLKIDKITVWDSGGGAGGTGSSTANFASSLIKSLPPLHEVARMAGMELPEFLGEAKGPDAPSKPAAKPAAPPPLPPTAPPPRSNLSVGRALGNGTWLETKTLRAAVVLALAAAACASQQPAAQAPESHPADAKNPNTAAESAADYSSAAGFTRAGLDLLRQGEPKGGWVSPQLLKLTNSSGLLVNLERIWSLCEGDSSTCNPELKHLVQEVLKVATRPESPKATPERLFAVIRPVGYFDGAPPGVRAESLFEPLAGDLVVVYVMDEGGAVRGAKVSDLKDLSLTRTDVPSVARRNLNAELPVPPNQRDCRPHVVGVWRSGSYFESSRLLLSDYWQGMADRTHSTIIAAAPAADSLVVVCDPTPEEIVKLRQRVEQLARQAARPVSNTLLEWTAAGWQELK